MDILYAPNGVLLSPSKPVKKVDDDVRKLITAMKKVLIASDIGVGLAAPQVGVSKRLFLIAPDLVDKKRKSPNDIAVFINPEIISKKPERRPLKKRKKQTLEGCLSIPRIWGPVHRSNQLTIRFTDENGIQHTDTFTGFPARIIQHEMDHLNGILFTQRVLEQNGKLYKQEKDTMKPVDI